MLYIYAHIGSLCGTGGLALLNTKIRKQIVVDSKTEPRDLDLGHPAPARHSVSSSKATSRNEGRPKSRLAKSRLALVDEFPLRRDSTYELLRTLLHERAMCFANTSELLADLHQNTEMPRGVIISLGGQSVADPRILGELAQLLSMLESTPVVVLSDCEGVEEVVAAFRAGVRGYVPTSMEPPVVVQAIRMVLSGGEFLPATALMKMRLEKQACQKPPKDTADIVALDDPSRTKAPSHQTREALRIRGKWHSRQLSILALIAEGKANKEIARALAVDESTVKSRVRQIMRKLGVTNRTQIALCARKLAISNASGAASPTKAETDAT